MGAGRDNGPLPPTALDPDRPVLAHFEDGPLAGSAHVFYRARPRHSRRVARGTVRRALRTRPRYASYEVTAVWWDDALQHGTYRFIGYRAAHEEDLGAAVFPD